MSDLDDFIAEERERDPDFRRVWDGAYEAECFVCHRIATVLPTSPNESRWSLCPQCDRP